jgi:hypothetical protein
MIAEQANDLLTSLGQAMLRAETGQDRRILEIRWVVSRRVVRS